MSAGFTPGPWQWVGSDEIEQAEHPFTSVAEAVRLPKNADPSGEQARANARLIAAAPELYEALEFAERQLDELINRHYGGSIPCTDEDADGFDKIESALAKARGEA